MKAFFSPITTLVTGIFIGMLIMALGIGTFLFYMLGTIRAGEWASAPSPVRSLGEQIRLGALQYESTSVYGQVVSIENGVLVLDTNGAMGPRTYTFKYDDGTTMVRLNNDDESTEIPITIADLPSGTGITVITEESVGGSEGLRIIKIVKL